MITGSWRQHFSGDSSVGEVFNFDPTADVSLANTALSGIARIESENNIMGVGGTDVQNEFTFSAWIYPQAPSGHTVDTAHHIFFANNRYVLIYGDGALHFSLNTTAMARGMGITVPFNQWNHVLISARRNHNETLSFGLNNGATFNNTTKISYNTGTGQRAELHVVINGVGKHRFIVPRQAGYASSDNVSWSEPYGYFRNDFATGTTGTNATFGHYSYNSASSDLFNSDGTTNSHIGMQPHDASNGKNFFKGDMYQFYLTNRYYDLNEASNVALFRNSDGTPVSRLPKDHRVLLRYVSPLTATGISGITLAAINKVTVSNRSRP